MSALINVNKNLCACDYLIVDFHAIHVFTTIHISEIIDSTLK